MTEQLTLYRGKAGSRLSVFFLKSPNRGHQQELPSMIQFQFLELDYHAGRQGKFGIKETGSAAINALHHHLPVCPLSQEMLVT